MSRQFPFLRSVILLSVVSAAYADQVPDPRYGRLPLHFEPNVGQAPPAARYFARAADYRFLITDTETILELNDSRHSTIRMKVSRATPGAHFEPLEKLSGISNYYFGNDPAKWRSNVPQYARLKRRDIYPGIDTVFYGTGGQIEYDWIVHPGADPSQIRMAYEGIDRLRLDGNGDLLLVAGSHEFRQKKPVVYQQAQDGQGQEVQGSYQLAANGTEARFLVGDYDHSRALVVDPALIYIAYQHGSIGDSAFGIAVDGAGNAYVTGQTASINFRTVTPAQPNNAGGQDAFIAKLNASGTALVYSTYLGGSNTDYGQAITVDNNGNAYVTGVTLSSDFPVKSAVQATKPGGTDGFVTKLDTNGAIVFSTYLGGSGADLAAAIAVDGSANIYVAGSTSSSNFPAVNALQPGLKGITNAFVVKLSPSGSSFLFSTYLGGATRSAATGIALGFDHDIWIAGSTGPFFPVVNPIQQSFGGGGEDAFIAKIDNSGSSLQFSTFLGGSNNDEATGIAVDGLGNILVAGRTFSADFPVVSPLQVNPDNISIGSAFVAKLSPTPPALLYSTYFTSGGQAPVSIAADEAGNATIASQLQTLPLFSLFPGIYNLPNVSQVNTVYAAQINPSGTTLLYATSVGELLFPPGVTALNRPNALAVDNAGNAYLAGNTANASFVVKLSQATTRCTASATNVSPQTFPSTGGAGVVTFTNPNACAFSVISTATPAHFLHFDYNFTGVGLTAGQIPFTVDPNFGIAQHASLLINGTGFTISVDGSLPTQPVLNLIGNWDTPVTSTNASGVLAISGWALNSKPISVEIYRNAIAREQLPGGLVFIGNGTFVGGSRPDVVAQHPEYPFNTNAGWSYALLTNALPNSDGSAGKGNGTYQLTVVIRDSANQITFTPRTITVFNGNASKPFGTIDTPAPGALISGKSSVNFGWALTPQPHLIPLNGSTINVFLDGRPSGALSSYNNFRADVAAVLPGYQNSNGAVGFAMLDTTTMTSGQHTISWGITDDNNQTSSAGNRTFTVLDGSSAAEPLESRAVRMVHHTEPVPKPRGAFSGHVLLRTGYDLEAPLDRLIPDKAWTYEIAIQQLDRLELHLFDIDSKPVSCTAYLAYAEQNLPLPVGSILDRETCTFYWQIDAAFLGEYPLVFSSELGNVRARVMVRPQAP